MSGREWKPGDVGVNERWDYRGIFVANCDIHLRVECWHNESGFSDPGTDDRRPLVVIDPEDREQVERLTTSLLEHDIHHGRPCYSTSCHVDRLADALRSLIEPPKPPEPLGLGAVVEAIHDNHFVHVGNGGWQRVEAGDRQGQICTYDEVAVIRVLSEGVASDV